MKKYIQVLLLSILVFQTTSKAQNEMSAEGFGKTLNVGFGLGYYGYVGHSMPGIHADFEFGVAKNFTIAPFLTIYSYRNYRYWGNVNNPYKNYYYRQTVMPIGVKGTYYFDQLVQAGSKWDFYLAASLGFEIRRTVWESGYYGETTVVHNNTNGLYLDGHIGTEYHINQKLGIYLDISTGISTFGISVHY